MKSIPYTDGIKIREIIANGKTHEVFPVLRGISGIDIDMVSNIEGEFTNLIERRIKGLKSNDEVERNEARIRDAILSLCGELKDPEYCWQELIKNPSWESIEDFDERFLGYKKNELNNLRSKLSSYEFLLTNEAENKIDEGLKECEYILRLRANEGEETAAIREKTLIIQKRLEEEKRILNDDKYWIETLDNTAKTFMGYINLIPDTIKGNYKNETEKFLNWIETHKYKIYKNRIRFIEFHSTYSLQQIQVLSTCVANIHFRQYLNETLFDKNSIIEEDITIGFDPKLGASWRLALLFCNWLSESSGLSEIYSFQKLEDEIEKTGDEFGDRRRSGVYSIREIVFADYSKSGFRLLNTKEIAENVFTKYLEDWGDFQEWADEIISQKDESENGSKVIVQPNANRIEGIGFRVVKNRKI